MRISATLIARNEGRCIARCLDSVRPWVDSMLVLDTGSTDGTPELARAHGAEVHSIDWPEDFARARNHALALADAEWHLVIDADEVLETGGELLRPWCTGASGLGRVCIHSTFDDAGAVSTGRSWITRVIPQGVRFEGRVHEQVASALPRERLDMHLAHDGYRDTQMSAKRDRNRILLLRDLEERPGDPYLAYQLGREAEGREEYDAACRWYARALEGAPSAAGWLHDLTVRHLHCLGQAGRGDEALAFAGSRMEAWQDSPDFYFTVGNLGLDRAVADPGHALGEWLPLAVSCWERCLELGERPELEGSVHGRGSHLARHNLDIVKAQLAAL